MNSSLELSLLETQVPGMSLLGLILLVKYGKRKLQGLKQQNANKGSLNGETFGYLIEPDRELESIVFGANPLNS